MSLKMVISRPPPIVVTLQRADQEASGAACPGIYGGGSRPAELILQLLLQPSHLAQHRWSPQGQPGTCLGEGCCLLSL